MVDTDTHTDYTPLPSQSLADYIRQGQKCERIKYLPEELVFLQEDPKVQLVSDEFCEQAINHEF